MVRLFYSEYGIENIARRVLTAYDARLYYGQPSAIPIEDLIEANGLSLEYQYLRKNGRILGKTIFDDGLEAVYDMERHEYTLFPVRAGTILVDASLCEEDASTGRFRFTCAHELAHWCLHKKLYLGTGESAALMPAAKETDMEYQANLLGSAITRQIYWAPRSSCLWRRSSGAFISCVQAGPPSRSLRRRRSCFRCPSKL